MAGIEEMFYRLQKRIETLEKILKVTPDQTLTVVGHDKPKQEIKEEVRS